ncbi:hypothetical protein [Mycoplasma sp. P36-A1]|uniref:hypothetical protein n=1 Tax=Mycoplasma sp. P36-A1 TaxID=3252900 RepID=UPI003C2E29DA
MAAQEILDNIFDEMDIKTQSLEDTMKKYFNEVGTPTTEDKLVLMQIYIDKLRDELIK